jgi:single-strand DNA-binding protein
LINNVTLVGRLTKDPDLRYTQSGTAVGQFTLAINRNFTNANNEREADFINCVIWRKAAESLANYARKGTLIGLTGRIQTRNYDNQQGQRVYVTEVVVENFQLLESKEINEQRRGQSTGQATFDKNVTSNEQPATENQTPDPLDPFSPENSPLDISDNDLPF